jgi:hypothetical protein
MMGGFRIGGFRDGAFASITSAIKTVVSVPSALFHVRLRIDMRCLSVPSFHFALTE